MPPETKSSFREAMWRRLAAYTAEDFKAASTQLSCAIARHEYWRKARVVGLYHGMAHLAEPTLELLHEFAEGRELAYPRVDGRGDMDFCLVRDPAALTRQELVMPGSRRRMSILQPDRDAVVVEPEELELLLIPGLAFTARGERLGRGGGFYDRYLAHPDLHAWKLGIGMPCQLVEELPLETHDHLLDAVLIAE